MIGAPRFALVNGEDRGRSAQGRGLASLIPRRGQIDADVKI